MNDEEGLPKDTYICSKNYFESYVSLINFDAFSLNKTDNVVQNERAGFIATLFFP